MMWLFERVWNRYKVWQMWLYFFYLLFQRFPWKYKLSNCWFNWIQILGKI